jgi:hypothetical protein
MLSKQEEEQERSGTYLSHAQSAANDTAGGRFAATGGARVIGSTPTPASQYPAASAHQADPVGPEPPLGVSIDAMPGFDSSAVPCDLTAAEQLGGAAAAPPSSSSLSSDVERAAPPSFSANEEDP